MEVVCCSRDPVLPLVSVGGVRVDCVFAYATVVGDVPVVEGWSVGGVGGGEVGVQSD